MDLKSFITSLSLPWRGDCINCGGKNSLSISIVDGSILYYCFRASCKLRGKTEYTLSILELKNYNSPKEEIKFIIPNFWVSPLQNKFCYAYLQRYNLIDFYSKHVDRIRYDPREHRCVFILKDDEGVIKGAVGRSLAFKTSPRWFVYTRNDGTPFYINSTGSNVCILVEDCISASYLIDNNLNSAALLGTNIPADTVKYLLDYDKLYIALDPDAISKALQLQHQLSIYKPTYIINLPCDPKYLKQEQIKELFKDVLND